MRCSLLLVPLLLGGCVSATKPATGDGPPRRQFTIERLAKGDIDTVVEVHQRRALRHLETLMVKLYKRNPVQLHRHPGATIEQRRRELFADGRVPDYPEFAGRRGIDCIRLALDPAYPGDRVVALVAGMKGMLMDAYGNRTEFWFYSQLDPQKLYNSARNIEIAVWKLSNSSDGNGTPLLLSNSLPGEPANLSYERLFGKLISLQDTIAEIIADSSNRVIKKVIQNMATAVFLPV
ncbi:MAG: hypothetical protein D6786_04945 [Gammaproteobacteria bacterium]|nr:MAG: hypothetical protein D6786_04945 [Gammaproteobacteria bacterium]